MYYIGRKRGNRLALQLERHIVVLDGIGEEFLLKNPNSFSSAGRKQDSGLKGLEEEKEVGCSE
jgi:hypothetical protein